METTTNYKLPQWVKADQIKMDTFNDAFGDIDKALKANADAAASKASSDELNAVQQEIVSVREANCLVKLAGPIVTTENNAAMEFDLSQIDMENVAALFFTLSVAALGGTMVVAANDTTVGTICSNNRSTSAGLIWLVPFDGAVATYSFMTNNASSGSYNGNGTTAEVNWAEIISVKLSGASYAGATATLFAVKK